MLPKHHATSLDTVAEKHQNTSLSGIITVYGLYSNPLWLRCFFPSLSLAASPDCGRAPEAVGLRADGSTVAKLGGKAKGFAGMVADDVTVHSRAHCSPKL